MRVKTSELNYRTTKRIELVNITSDVVKVTRESGVKHGICIIHVPHATASIIVNEDEGGLKEDIIHWISKNIPWNAGWKHNQIDDNAASHIAAAILGNARVLPIVDGELVRGTWQEIFLVELDGPRMTRRVVVTIMGE